MGPSETASSRLTLSQAFNALGTTVAPLVGGALLFTVAGQYATKAQEAESVIFPYIGLAALLVILAIIFTRISLPTPSSMEEKSTVTPAVSILSYRHLVLGAIAIFMYVGAEVAIGSLLVNFFGLENIAGLAEADAAHYVAYYWGGAMVGRFIGAALMQRIAAGKLLTINALVIIVLIVSTILNDGHVAMWSILLVGLFNSIMFPTIFSLALKDLGPQTSRGSGLLCLAIVGGAILPVLQGVTADSIGLQISFIIPVACYVYIAYYGVIGSKPVTK
jgi:FHS family L-fucose permease-like MFS transporter